MNPEMRTAEVDTGAGRAEARPERAETALEEALAERNRLWEELHQRKSQERELEYYRGLSEQMADSLSWRLTAPLRRAKELAGRVRARLHTLTRG